MIRDVIFIQLVINNVNAGPSGRTV